MGVRRVRAGCEFVYVAAVDTPAVFQVEPLDAAPVSLAGRSEAEAGCANARSSLSTSMTLCHASLESWSLDAWLRVSQTSQWKATRPT